MDSLFMIKINGIELSTGKILKETLFAFQQTLGDKFTFQQDNNLKHKAKYTLELLTMTTLNVPEWPSYSFDLNRRENLCQENGCLASNDQQPSWQSLKNKKIIMCKYCTIQVWKALRDLPRKTHSCNHCQWGFWPVLTEGCDYLCKFDISVFHFISTF